MNPPIALSSQQLNFFETFGFLHFPGLIADRIGEVSDAFDTLFENQNGVPGGPHDGTVRTCMLPFLDKCEYLSSLLDDARINGIASSILGDDYNYMGSDGNYYVGDTYWHRDGCMEREFRHLKIAFYLDPVTSRSGALRVIPGSHRIDDRFGSALTSQVFGPEANLGVNAWNVPSVALET